MKKPQQIFVGGDVTMITKVYELLCKLGYQSFDSTGVDFWVAKNAQYLVIGCCKNYIDYNFSIERNYETIDCAYLRNKIVEKGKGEFHCFKVKNSPDTLKFLGEIGLKGVDLVSTRHWIGINAKSGHFSTYDNSETSWVNSEKTIVEIKDGNDIANTMKSHDIKFDKYLDEFANIHQVLISENEHETPKNWIKVPDKAEVLMKLRNPNNEDCTLHFYGKNNNEDDALLVSDVYQSNLEGKWLTSAWSRTGYFSIHEIINTKGMELLWRDDDAILNELDSLIGESTIDEDGTVKEENKFKMKSVVHKYPIPFQEGFELNLPKGSQVVRIDTVDGFNFLWALHEVSDNPEIVTYKFVSSKTGGEIEHEKPLTFVGMYSIFIQMELLLYVFLEDIVDSNGNSIISEYDKTQSTCWRG